MRHPSLSSPLTINYAGWVSSGGTVPARGCAADSAYTMLVTSPDSIRRFSINAGVGEVLAGRVGGAPGLDDGQGSRARFSLFASTRPVMHRDLAWFSEPRVRRIRTVSHTGEVTTRFRDVEATSVAVTDDFVYATIDDGVQRAPIGGGAWQTINGVVPANSALLGALDDGRVVLLSPATVFFVDPATFTLTPPIAERLGVIAGVHITEFDPAVGGWTHLAGQPFTAAVVPGPLSRALLHRPTGVGVFENGDLLVPDMVENAMLIIE